MTSACCFLIAAAVLLYEKPERVAYTAILPPDTVHLRSPAVDSIGRVIARCFGKSESVTKEVLWFTSDSSLGVSTQNGKPWWAHGRWYPEARAVVLHTRYAADTGIINHEWRHPVTKRLHTKEDPAPEIFDKRCP
jgi:hypothetical protein